MKQRLRIKILSTNSFFTDHFLLFISSWGLCNDNAYGLTGCTRTAKGLGVTPPCSIQGDFSLIDRKVRIVCSKVSKNTSESVFLTYILIFILMCRAKKMGWQRQHHLSMKMVRCYISGLNSITTLPRFTRIVNCSISIPKSSWIHGIQHTGRWNANRQIHQSSRSNRQ